MFLDGKKNNAAKYHLNYLSIKILKILIMNLGIGDMMDQLMHLKFVKHQIET
tara:strand:+ start:450 stop:605 length:156 start_codon:yes stop_codon:yes gene_type:complete